ncbi:hypothetical protein PhCBS80983_g05612 [Powellomyces hirtus]|uniref:Dicer-like protein 1 n=1 Tax=Powellomyces hirtus TaxID=109895 RepID=A0A507DUY2_9FUNG|nr:hypothetical protein PhCBS80983_g05612 [Powellomyces hirtus]
MAYEDHLTSDFPIITNGLKPSDASSRAARRRPTVRQLKAGSKFEAWDETKGPIEQTRNYQNDILERAKTQNIIAVMDTGTGKTLPAAMLIKYMLAKEEEARKTGAKKRVALFLVPTVPLVWQQKDYLKHQLQDDVAPICGKLLNDKMVDWQKIVKDYGAVCATPQVIVEAMNHAYITMDQICLIIFDEAHHAIGEDPYAILMREHYWKTSKSMRPRIMGLTASPVASDDKAMVAIDNLETILDCTAITIILTAEDRLRFAARAKPEKKFYPMAPNDEQEPKILKVLEENVNKITAIDLKKARLDGTLMWNQLGSWACARSILAAMDRLQDKADRAILDGWAHEEESPAELDRQRALLRMKLAECRPQEEPLESEISTKVRTLCDILEGYREDASFSGIVFVQRRDTAERLRDVLANYAKTKSFLRVAALMGNRAGSPEGMETTMRMTEQNTILRDFRQGHLNLLVATKVAEEGLDIPECKLVIRFDMGKENMVLLNFIQCRGRARAQDARFIVMIEEDNWEEQHHLQKLREQEKQVRTEMSKHKGRIRTAVSLGQLSNADDEVLKLAPHTYVVDSTGARISLTSAVALLNHFCTILEVDEYTQARPEYACLIVGSLGVDERYAASVTLPSVLPVDMRYRTGKPMKSKQLAYRSAALEAVKMLHERHYLDNHLRPTFERTYCHMTSGDLEDEERRRLQTDLLSLRSKKKGATWPITLPENLLKCWRPTESDIIEAHLNIIDFAPAGQNFATSVLGLISVSQLPTSPLEFSLWPQLIEAKVRVQSSSQKLSLSLKQYQLARSYNHLVLSPMLQAKLFPNDNDYSLLVVPLKIAPGTVVDLEKTHASTLIDWENAEYCQSFEPSQHRQRIIYTDEVSQHILVDAAHWDRKYFAIERLDDKNPFDPVPFTDTNFKCAADWYKRKKAIRQDQPVIKARLVTRKFNMVASHSIAEVESVDAKRDGDVFLIPQYCQPYPIKQNVLKAAVMLPSILYYIEVTCRAAELRQKLELPVTMPKLIEALAAPSAVMQNNYQRLETLGDAFLKAALTLHLYALYPDRHEGVMTMMSHKLQSNYELYQRGKAWGLPGYIISCKLARSEWRPMIANPGWEKEIIIDDDGNTEFENPTDKPKAPSAVTLTHRLSTKQIADTVEAILGACLDDSGVQGAAQALHNMFSVYFRVDWAEYAIALEDLPKPQGEMRADKKVFVAKVEELTGYKFKNPWLLAEALTHPSSPDLSVQSYQRLEYLGDAILGMLAVRHFFYKYPNLPPGRLTDLKDAAVNNAFLACISANLGLHYYIDRFSAAMDQDIADYCTELYEEAQRHEASASAREELLERSKQYIEAKRERNQLQRQLEAEMQYWINLETPKALSDVFEAILGAVFVDNNFDHDSVWNFLRRNWLPWVDKYVQPHVVGRHPYRELALYLKKELKCDAWRMPAKHNPDGHLYVANLIIHKEIVMACSGTSRKSARRLLAETVLERLEEEPTFLQGGCDCAPEDVKDDFDETGILEKDIATMCSVGC